ncbi:SWIM zinc finger family protein [Pyrodictium abyssi]|uniref:SWIM zinc finger family protein n=1 Tax=Pyrodictium abyssi TaxID=54256 RepID=UPI003B9812EA
MHRLDTVAPIPGSSKARYRGSKRLLLEAARIINQGRLVYVRIIGPDAYVATVRGSKDVYTVYYNPARGYLRCTCPASTYHRLCKHAIAAKMYIDNLLRGVTRGSAETSYIIDTARM